MHAKESVMRGGHHGAYCTSVVEASHKRNIKLAARYSRTYASRNKTQEHMLTWILRQKVWGAAIELALLRDDDEHISNADASENTLGKHRLQQPIQFQQEWSPPMNQLSAQALRKWGNTILSKDVLVSRAEVLGLLRMKLKLRNTLANDNRMLNQLHLGFYGAFEMQTEHGFRRTFVGRSSLSRERRDFVRIKDAQNNNTSLSAQVRKLLLLSIRSYCCVQNIIDKLL